MLLAGHIGMRQIRLRGNRNSNRQARARGQARLEYNVAWTDVRLHSGCTDFSMVILLGRLSEGGRRLPPL